MVAKSFTADPHKDKPKRKPKKTADELRAEFVAAEFPPEAHQLNDTQAWQIRMLGHYAARKELLKLRPYKEQKSRKYPEIIEELLMRLSNGESLSSICEDAHMPCDSAVKQWRRDDIDFAAAYNRAKAEYGEMAAEEMMELADEARFAPPELTQAYRLAVDARRWVAGKLAPKRYGDKLTLSGDEENPLAIQHVMVATELVSKIRGE